jgi:hypothetical protein
LDHAEAIELLADLALEPGRLASVDTDPSPEGAGLRTHVAGCAACAAELAAMRRARSAMASRGADGETGVTPPPALRARTLAAVAADRPMDAAPGAPASNGAGDADMPAPRATGAVRHGRRLVPWLAAAAAVAIAVGVAGLGLLQAGDADRVRAENSALAATTAALGAVLADPGHRVAGLRTADGSPGGTVAWTADEVVVVASGLPALAPGRTYRCWVEYDGVRTPIGSMVLSGSTGHWVGSGYGSRDLLRPGGRFGVSVVTEDGASTPVLTGEL